MSATIRLWDLAPSPNNKKVRLALGYKGIPYVKIPVTGADRGAVVEVSGQPLTPVLQHGDTVVFDSGAILRYLEANVKREPRLYSADYDTMKAIEKWEGWARTSLAPPVGTLFGQFFATEKSAKELAGAQERFDEACRHLESSINDSGVLVGDAVTAADITCGAWMGLALLSPEEAATHPILAFFRESLKLDPSLAKTRTWAERINRYDR